jgi:hypothetical protein
VAREGFGFEDEIKRIVLKKKRFDSDVLYKVFSHSDKDLYNYY